MRAVRANCEDGVAGLHQQNFVLADTAQQLPVRELRQFDAAGEIGPLGCIILLHGDYLRC
jgi:hypothetical protein